MNKILVGIASLIVLGIGGFLGLKMHSDEVVLGAATSPDISSPYVSWGGVESWNAGKSLTATSSIPCSLQNTSGATTSLAYFGAHINTNGIAANQTFDLATSSTAYGTSSPAFVKAGTITSSAQKDIVWQPGVASTTVSGVIATDSFLKTGESPFIVAPNEYVNFRIATGTPGTFAAYYGGSCGMSLRVLGR